MLESNTEATGTGSKLGTEAGVEQRRALRGQAAFWAPSGVLPSPWQERHAMESQPAAQETRDKGTTGEQRMARGRWEQRP